MRSRMMDGRSVDQSMPIAPHSTKAMISFNQVVLDAVDADAEADAVI